MFVFTTGALTRSYQYDAAGNTLSDGMCRFTYNGAGRLTSATRAGVTTNYMYNALGQRIQKANATGSTLFAYDEQGHLIGEYDQNGLVQELVWLGDIPVATLRTDQGGTNTGLFYIHTDHLNAPTKITRTTNNEVIWRWDHDPYGNGAPSEDPDGNNLILSMNLRYPGQYFDTETGLYYNYFRYYDPQAGRYVTSDPIGLAGGQFSTYAYVNGDPLSFIDPSGLADLNLFDPRPNGHDSTGNYAGANNWDIPGMYTVAGHGNPGNMQDDRNAPRYTPMWPKDLADLIKKDPNWRKQPVTVASCNTGNSWPDGFQNKHWEPFAQSLANELGVPVTAPTGFVYFRADGTGLIGSAPGRAGPFTGPSQWKTFYPR